MTILKLKKCYGFKSCSHYIKDIGEFPLLNILDENNFCSECQKKLFTKFKKKPKKKIDYADFLWKNKGKQRFLI